MPFCTDCSAWGMLLERYKCAPSLKKSSAVSHCARAAGKTSRQLALIRIRSNNRIDVL